MNSGKGLSLNIDIDKEIPCVSGDKADYSM